jgi:hypothetical protein
MQPQLNYSQQLQNSWKPLLPMLPPLLLPLLLAVVLSQG